jgi:hypothetical protein
LLAEVRQSRHELQASNATTQRVQIALYRLQQQQQAVARAKDHLNDVQKKLTEVQTDKSNLALHIEQTRATVNHTNSLEESTHLEEVVLPELKAQLEMLEKQENQVRRQESEAEQQLRDEQVKLDGVNDLLDRFSTSLDDSSRRSANNPH